MSPAFEECRTRLVSSELLKSSRKNKMHCETRRLRAALRAASCVEPGGANRDRTGDLLLAKQALSQLSYGPVRERDNLNETASATIRSGAGVGWWVWMDSNHRPPPYQDDALTS